MRVVKRSVLPGGLRVITEQVPASARPRSGIWVGIGSRDEPAAVAGAAHYLEHLLFKGTRTATPAQIAEEIDAVGGELNAFTAKEHTCYYAHVLDEDLPLAVDLVTRRRVRRAAAPNATWRSSAASCSRRSPCATTTPRTCCTRRSARR